MRASHEIGVEAEQTDVRTTDGVDALVRALGGGQVFVELGADSRHAENPRRPEQRA